MIKKIVLIPSYEPNNILVNLVDELRKEQFEVVVIDDGSTNKDIFNKLKNKCKLISYEKNMGKGYALKTGLKYIKDNYKNNYFIITMDSDGQHTISDAKKLLKTLEKNNNSLILGKRIRDKSVPFKSKFGNNITKFVFKLVTGKSIYDTQTGFRAFSNNLIDFMINIEGNRYEYEMNVLLSSIKNNINIIEEKISTIYINKNKNSHFDTIKDSLLIYKQIIKYKK